MSLFAQILAARGLQGVAAEEFLHQQRAVEADGRVQAVVAVAAGGAFFAEVAQ